MPDQLVNKSVNHGFCFNILCIGETGLGKSTLMDTLFNTKFEGEPTQHNQPGVQLKSNTYELQESNVRLMLTVVNTVGFGDQINKEDSYKSIVEFIDTQFEAYLQEELKIKRTLHSYHDTRIHACLYFIAPTGHSLKSLDLVTMKKLDSKVNIIPIIAKSDAISKSELTKFKIKITSELVSNGVLIYQFPIDDETVAEINSTMNAHLPFAVVGSTEEVKIGNKMVKARQYPWGTVQVENENHCDFVKLREMLIRVNMEDLREQTHTRHYELYRRCKLEEMGFKDTDPDCKPFSCTRSLTGSRSCTRMRRRSWRTRRNPWMTSSTASSRKRRPLSSYSPRLCRQGAPPHSRGTRRGKINSSTCCMLHEASCPVKDSCRNDFSPNPWQCHAVLCALQPSPSPPFQTPHMPLHCGRIQPLL
uniref:Septin 6 n=1 Tax=Oncorhynchus kisutch TaxID=8019 RepID=A0A8C7HW60_ONCKI